MAAILSLTGYVTSHAADSNPHLDLGLELVSQIQAKQQAGIFVNNDGDEINRFGGSWGNVYFQLENQAPNPLPECYAQSSSFVTLLLNQTYGWNWHDHPFIDPVSQLIKERTSPSSYQYAALIEQQVGFESKITRLDLVQPGDIFTTVNVGGTSGYTGIIAGVNLQEGLPYPENLNNSNPAFFGTTFYPVEVLDSTSSDHSFDTRTFEHQGQLMETEGVGVGMLGMLVNVDFEVVGYTWSLPTSDYDNSPNGWINGLHSRLKTGDVRKVTMGRFQPVMESELEEIENVSNFDSNAFPLHYTMGLDLVAQIVQQQSKEVYIDEGGVELNRYGGSWSSDSDQVFIQWADLGNGIPAANYSRCSSFVTLLLKSAYNWNWWGYTFFDPITNQITKTSSPHAYRYVALIKQLIGFQAKVTNIDQALPGDIIATQDAGDDSGHVMIFSDIDWQEGVAYPENLAGADPTWFGTTFYPVEVLDVTSGPHSSDTREVAINGQPVETQGAGVGWMGVLVNPQMEIVAHTWSLPTSDFQTSPNAWLSGLHNRLKTQQVRELVIGRLESQP